MKKYIALLLAIFLIANPANAYIIQPGDTLSGLARRFNTTISTLVSLNNIVNPDLIYAGNNLILPNKSTSEQVFGGTPTPTSSAARMYVEAPDFQLFNGAAAGDTTLTLDDLEDIYGNEINMDYLGTKGYGRINPDGVSESISFSGITTNSDGTKTLTGVKTVQARYPYTETSGLVRSHSIGSLFRLTNTAGFYNDLANKENAEIVEGQWRFASTTTFSVLPLIPTTTPTDPQHPISLDYLTTVTTTGCANASEIVRGCGEIATDAEYLSGTYTGGTGANLWVSPSSTFAHDDEHFSNNISAGESFSTFDILYVSSTGRYQKARATQQNTVDRIAAVAYEDASASSSPRVFFPGSIIQEVASATTSVGYTFPSTGSTSTIGGSGAIWNSPGNVTSSDLLYATSSIPAFQFTEYLVATNFGFSIPANATIVAFEATINKRITSGSVNDQRVRVWSAGSALSGDLDVGAAWPTSDTDSVYGGLNATGIAAGALLTPTIVNSSGFGVAISAQEMAGGTSQAFVNYMKINIYYTIAPNFTSSSVIYLSDLGRASTSTGTIRKPIGIALGKTVWQFNPTIQTPTSSPGSTFTPVMTSASGTIPQNFVATSTNTTNLSGGDFLRSTSTGAFWGQLGTTSTNSSRSLNTTYQNTTTQSIFLSVTVNLNSVNTGIDATAVLLVSGTSTPGIEVQRARNNAAEATAIDITVPLTYIVPPGHYYRVNSSGSGVTSITNWNEMRI